MLEQTFFMLKPDALSRQLEDKIWARIKEGNFKIKKKKTIRMTDEFADRLYAVHHGKPFFTGLKKFITSGDVCVSILEGEGAIQKLRDLMGATDPRKASLGTIRGDFKEYNILSLEGTIKNLVHGSDSVESASYEIPIFFSEEERR